MAITLGNNSSIITTGPNSNSTIVPVAIPTGSWAPQANDLILKFIGTGSGADYDNTPDGWPRLEERSMGGVAYGLILAREWQPGDADATATAAGPTQYSIITQVWRPSAGKRLHVEAIGAELNTSNVNPPALTPSGGTQDYLAIACAMLDGSSGSTVTGAPTGYSSLEVAPRSSSAGAIVATARKQLTAATSEDPGPFTSGNEQSAGFTVMLWEYDATISLAPANGTHGHAASSPVMAPNAIITAASGLHTEAATSPSVTPGALQINSGVSAHGSSSPAIATEAPIAPANSIHGHSASSPAMTHVPELPSAPAIRYHAGFSDVTKDGDGLILTVADLQELAGASASEGDGPEEIVDALGRKCWRFSAAQWLTIAGSVNLWSRNFAAFFVCKPHLGANPALLSAGVNGSTAANTSAAIARITAPATSAAVKPFVGSRQAYAPELLVGEQLQVIGFQGTGSGGRVSINRDGFSLASAPTSGAGDGGEIGRYSFSPSGTYFNGDLYEVDIYNTALSDANFDAVAAALCDAWGIADLTDTYVTDGDSITFGLGTSSFENMRALMVDDGGAWRVPATGRVINVAVTGSGFTKTGNLNPATRRDTADSVYDPERQLGGTRTVFLQIGANDVDDTAGSGDAAYGYIVGYLNTADTGLLQLGWKVVLGVNISEGINYDGGINQLRLRLRDPQLLADCDADSGGAFEGQLTVVDLPSITYGAKGTVFDTNADTTDTDIYQDTVHPTTLGSQLMWTGGDTPQYGYYSALATLPLNVESATLGHSATSLSIASRAAIEIASASHGDLATSPLIAPNWVVSPDSGFSAQTASIPTISPQGAVAPDSASHAHIAASPTIGSRSPAAANDGLHAHWASSPMLGSEIPIESGNHAHMSGSPSLASRSEIVASDGFHGFASEDVVIAARSALSAESAVHGHSASQPTVAIGGALAASAGMHGHSAEEPAIVSRAALLVTSALHGHLAASPSIAGAAALAVQSASHFHMASLPAIGTAYQLMAANGQHTHFADQVGINARYPLTVDGAQHAHAAGTASIATRSMLTIQGGHHDHAAATVDLGGRASARFIVMARPRPRTVIATARNRIVRRT